MGDGDRTGEQQTQSGLSYTVCITSCNRHDLLQRTLESLVLDIPPKEILIAEDSPALPSFDVPPSLTWINKAERMGQLDSADRLMSRVTTPYVFWCEDDWKFHAPVSAFLPDCQKILDSHSEVLTVSLRGNTRWHPLVTDSRFPFLIAQPDWNGWGGFSFNPGLRRLSDYTKMGTYQSLAGERTLGSTNERNISRAYLKAGYVIADLNRILVAHTGTGRSRAIESF